MGGPSTNTLACAPLGGRGGIPSLSRPAVKAPLSTGSNVVGGVYLRLRLLLCLRGTSPAPGPVRLVAASAESILWVAPTTEPCRLPVRMASALSLAARLATSSKVRVSPLTASVAAYRHNILT